MYNNNAADAANYHHITQLVAGTSPAISGDGSVIVVEQGGTSLGGYDQQGHLLFTITPASVGASGAVWKPAISADGHLVAFWNSDAASAGGAGHLFTFDRSTGVVTEIAATASGAGNNAASISADGRYVTYQSDSSGHPEIYLYDLKAGQVVFHTANASGGSYNPVISPDGHFIIFASDAKLTGNDTNSVADTYVVNVTDPNHPTFKLVSVGADGASGNAASDLGAAISTGGKFIAFGSSASNFANGDNNGSGDIFVVDPSSGRDVIIEQNSHSPSVLTASGTIVVTGGIDGVTISVSDPSKFSATFSADGQSIEWNFHENKSDFSSLAYGQDASQAFTITLSSDTATVTIPVSVTVHNAVQNAAPVLNSATLTVSEGDTVVFGPGNIGISDADDSSFTFKVTGVSHGQFQVFDDGQWYNTATFTSAELAGGLIRFIHDGSEFAPTFAIQADDLRSTNHRSNILAGTVNFTHVNDAPQVKAAALVVAPGDTVVLGAANLNITHTDSFADFSGYPTRADLSAFSNDTSAGSTLTITNIGSPQSIISVNDPDSSSFTFKVSNVTHGVFQTYDGDTWVDATTFTSADLNAGHVRFVREDSADTPTFSIQADDGAAANHAGSVFAGTVSDQPIVVTINTPPTITAASLTVSEAGTVVLKLADIAVTDPDSSNFTFTVSGVTHGTFETTTDGTHWTAATQFTSADLNASHVRFAHDGSEFAPAFSIQADDRAANNHLGNTFTGSVAFTNVNDAPTATPVVLTAGTEDTAYTIYSSDLLSHVSDPDGPYPLSITDVSLVSGGGALTDNHDGTWTYLPTHNYDGPVSFNYTASDGLLTSASTASLTVGAETAQTPLVAVGSDATTSAGAIGGSGLKTPIPGAALHAGDVVTFDWNYAGSSVAYQQFAVATINGTAFLLSDRTVSSGGETPWHTFTYTVTADGHYDLAFGALNHANYQDTTLVVDNIRVNGSVAESYEIGISFSTVLGNGFVTSSFGAQPTDGDQEAVVFAGNADPFADRHRGNESQLEHFLGLANGALATITNPVGSEHTPVNIPIAAYSQNLGSPDDLYVTVSGAPVGSQFNHGVYNSADNTWRIEATDLDGSLTLTTPIGYTGTFDLSVTATSVMNGTDTSATSAAKIQPVTINGVAPVATPVTLTAGSEDHAYIIHSSDLLAGVTDIGATPLSILSMSVASGGGHVVDNDDGTFTYTPAHNYNGPVSFNYTASDGSLTSSSTASLALTAVNDAPIVSGPVTGDATEDGAPVFLKATANASDPDGDVLQAVHLPDALPAGVSFKSTLQGFILDPSDVAYQHLASGERHHGHGQLRRLRWSTDGARLSVVDHPWHQ